MGPNLTTPRANVSVVSVAGKLYAIGGFAGKFFLNTIEYLDPSTNEWTTFVKQNISNDSTINSNNHSQNGAHELEKQLEKLLSNMSENNCTYQTTNGCYRNGNSESNKERQPKQQQLQMESRDSDSGDPDNVFKQNNYENDEKKPPLDHSNQLDCTADS